MKLLKKVLLSFWLLTSSITLIAGGGNLEFQNESLSNAFFIILCTGYPCIQFLIPNSKNKKKTFGWLTIGALTFSIGIIWMINFITWGGGFKTEFVLYRNKKNPTTRIELQVEELGSFGSNQRTVIVKEYTPLLYSIEVADKNEIDFDQWDYVEEHINEYGHKGEIGYYDPEFFR